MKTRIVLTLGIGLLLLACGSQKEVISEADRAKLEGMVNAKTMYLDAEWANPLATRSMNSVASAGLLPPGSNPNRIDIIGTASYIKIHKDSVSAILPYYGERQFGSTYNQKEVGIQFEGVPDAFEMEYDAKKQAYTFEFDIVNEFGEGFNVSGTLFPNFRTNFYINSTERMTIGYWGSVKDLEE